uniref:Tryptophan synthase alpha chain n=1 Tax=Riquetophycus sp. TaxID=1897556 RepID=A0A1C9C859_9FLOR|nr:tryptophan synthase alpha subunit [Riquetophycus sp.]
MLLCIIFYMNIISQILRNKKSPCALVPFITAGYPDYNSTINALYALDSKGADIIELGIPYSDALADGPIIQESSRIALKQGVYIDQVLNILNTVSRNLRAPIVIFTYYNPVLVKGIKQFILQISRCGASGLIIPDLPLEETDYVITLCNAFNIELILFIAPTSSEARIRCILSKSPGCIYLVSSNGVTGLRNNINSDVSMLASKIKHKTNKILILGFGISNPKQASEISKWDIDGIVIGSAFMQIMSNKSPSEAVKSLADLCQNIRYAIDS